MIMQMLEFSKKGGFVNDITMVDCTVFVIAADDADRIDIVIEE